jgi:hypothetical protein
VELTLLLEFSCGPEVNLTPLFFVILAPRGRLRGSRLSLSLDSVVGVKAGCADHNYQNEAFQFHDDIQWNFRLVFMRPKNEPDPKSASYFSTWEDE